MPKEFEGYFTSTDLADAVIKKYLEKKQDEVEKKEVKDEQPKRKQAV